jgi:hypothetical protein
MRPKNASSRRCGFWGVRRCRGGGKHAEVTEGKFASNLICIAKVKKVHWHTKLGEIAILEPQYRFGRERVRPFVRSARVTPRTCSQPLQRAITDFAADQSFALARIELQEHYGFMIGESTIQRIVLGHARNMFEAGRPSLDFPKTAGRHKHIISQTDGGMIPIVEPDPDQKDKRIALMERGQDFAGARQGRAVQRSLRKTIASTASRPPSAAANRS